MRRQYADNTVEVLAVIMLCQRSGFTLAEIGTLLNSADPSAWRRLAADKITELDARLVNLERARDGLRHALDCPNTNIMRCEHFRANLHAVLPTHEP